MKFLICISFFFSFSSFAQWYAGPGIGYSRYTNEQIKKYDQSSSGPRYGINGGYRYVDGALEGFYNYTKTKTDDLIYNNTKYLYHAKMQTLGLLAKYFVSIAHIRFGFATHWFNSYVTYSTTGSEVNDTAVKNEFGAEGKKTYYGPLFGAGIDAPIDPVTPYIVFTSYQLNGTKSDIFETELGLKIKF